MKIRKNVVWTKNLDMARRQHGLAAMLADVHPFNIFWLLGIGSGGGNSIVHLFLSSTINNKLGFGFSKTSYESQHCSKPNRYLP